MNSQLPNHALPTKRGNRFLSATAERVSVGPRYFSAAHKLIVFLALTFCGLSPVHAAIATASTIEWLTCKAETVVVAKISSVTSVKGPGDVIYEDCVLSVSEVIKGAFVKDLNFCYRHLSGAPLGWKTSKGDLLVFLSVHKTPYDEKQLHLYTDPYYEVRLHGLLMPVEGEYPLPIFDLSNLPKHVYSKEMRRLTEREEILKIARIWAVSTISYPLLSEVSYDSPIFKALYGGSACFLVVPAEEKYRAHFLTLAGSKNPSERQQAASELYKFPGAETERVLMDLLKDDTENIWFFSADTISNVEFGVRAAACRSLKELGNPVSKVETERKPTAEEKRSLRQTYWQKSFTEALSGEWNVLSVKDGDTRAISGEERDTTSVIVTCGKGEARCKFTLIPKEWNNADYPAGENLGINGRNGQGSRYFFFEGDMPQAVREKLTRYFGLEKF